MDMYYTVLSTLKRFETAWQGIPKFEQGVQELESKIAAIESLTSTIESSKKLAAEKKERAEKVLITKVHALLGMAKSYARSVNDQELVTKFTVTKTSLAKGSMTERVNRISRLVDEITALETALSDYGVDTNLLMELIAKRDEFVNIIRLPREQVVKRKENRYAILEIVKSIDILLRESLFSMIVMMKKDHPQFAKQFEIAMVIIDRHNRRTPGASFTEEEGTIPFDSD